MPKVFFLIIGLLLGLSGPALAQNTSVCQARLFSTQFTSKVESFSRGEISLSELNKKTGANSTLKFTAVKTVQGHEFTESEIFTDKSDLIIGIDVTGSTKGHMYLVINSEARIDGRMFYAPTTVEREKWVLSNGLILRYKNIPEANRQKLLAWLNSSKPVKGPTCVSVGGKIVFDIGDLGVPERNYWFPSTFLSFIAKTGLVGADGRRLTPQVYLMNSDIRLFWNNLPHVWTVPRFIFKVLLDPYTWQGAKVKRRPGWAL